VLAAGTCARHDLEAIDASLKAAGKDDQSVVARADELYAQQQKATFGVWKNLGLSLPLPLKKELTDREHDLYQRQIVGALLSGHAAAMENASLKDAAGLAPLVAAYR